MAQTLKPLTWSEWVPNPFAAIAEVATPADRIVAMDILFMTKGWSEVEPESFLDDLLQEIGGKTNIVVQYRREGILPALFRAAYDEGGPRKPDLEDHEKKWTSLVNAQGWSEESQIIHLEGFIRQRGLFGQLVEYAQAAAEEENANTVDTGD